MSGGPTSGALGRLLRASLLLTALNLATGVLHYLYQVVAAGRLGLEELGVLNVEMTYLSLVLAAGMAARYWPVFEPQTRARRRVFLGLSVAVAGATLAYCAWRAGGSAEGSTRRILMASVPAMVLAQYWLGVFQARRAFFTLGLGTFLIGALKFGTATADASGGLAAFALANVWAAGGALMGAACIEKLLASRWPEPEIRAASAGAAGGTPSAATAAREGFALALATAVGYVLFPAYDLLNIRHILGAEAAGQFSRLQLFSKMLYFAPGVLLQVTLPYHVRAFRGEVHPTQGDAQAERAHARRLEVLTLGACYAGAGVFAVAGPWAARVVLGIEGLSGVDVFLACAAMIPQYGLLAALQIAAAARRLGLCVALLASVALSPALAWALALEDLRIYLLFATLFNTLLGWAAHRAVEKTNAHLR